jgi:FkbM family methyltransferase
MLIPFSDIINKFRLRPKGVLHVGAWDGMELQDYLAHDINYCVFIEANKSIMPTLQGRVAPYKRCRAINACISDRVEQVNFKITNNGQSSSILDLGTHKEEHPEVVVTETITMMAKPLKQVIEEDRLHMEELDFMNIDVQGAELKVLMGMGDYINYVNAIYLEVNHKELYKHCPLVHELDLFLEDFVRLDTKFTTHGWGDAIYLRK